MKLGLKLNSNQKSQAAMEFLITYGWALLVVLIAIGALAFTGVLKPSKYLPEKVTISPGLRVTQASIDENTVILAVSNGLGETLRDFTITIEDCVGGAKTSGTVYRFLAGKTELISVSCDTSEYTNSKFKSDIIVNYTTKKLNNELSHSKKGSLDWQAQAGTDTTISKEDVIIESFNGAGSSYSASKPVVINETNGHIWQASDSNVTMVGSGTCYDGTDGCLNQTNAIVYCKNLKLCKDGTYQGNHSVVGDCSAHGGDLITNWRLPSGDNSDSNGYDLDPYGVHGNLDNYFKESKGFSKYNYYWLKTTYPPNPDDAYYMYLDTGYVDPANKDGGNYDRARCVRDQ